MIVKFYGTHRKKFEMFKNSYFVNPGNESVGKFVLVVIFSSDNLEFLTKKF